MENSPIPTNPSAFVYFHSSEVVPPPIFLSELLIVNSRRARLSWAHTAVAEPESTDPFIFIWMEFKNSAESYLYIGFLCSGS